MLLLHANVDWSLVTSIASVSNIVTVRKEYPVTVIENNRTGCISLVFWLICLHATVSVLLPSKDVKPHCLKSYGQSSNISNFLQTTNRFYITNIFLGFNSLFMSIVSHTMQAAVLFQSTVHTVWSVWKLTQLDAFFNIFHVHHRNVLPF